MFLERKLWGFFNKKERKRRQCVDMGIKGMLNAILMHSFVLKSVIFLMKRLKFVLTLFRPGEFNIGGIIYNFGEIENPSGRMVETEWGLEIGERQK